MYILHVFDDLSHYEIVPLYTYPQPHFYTQQTSTLLIFRDQFLIFRKPDNKVAVYNNQAKQVISERDLMKQGCSIVWAFGKIIGTFLN